MMVYHKFQSLIGNVQQNPSLEYRTIIMFQSLIGNVQLVTKQTFFLILHKKFQSLIGNVQPIRN